MVRLTHPKSPLSSLDVFSTMNKSSSSSLTTMKVKTLIHNLIFSHICRLIRALSKAKSIFLEIFLRQSKKRNKYRNKILFGSFRLHYNWCSSSAHVLPIPSPILVNTTTTPHHLYFDSTWKGNEKGYNGKEDDEGQLSTYLQWLEDKGANNNNNNNDDEVNAIENEIDMLADMFIANCHEKFRLEKIESYRRYQELLARTL